jgi:hypothetical protein
MNTESNSYKAGIQAVKSGNNINNSYPFKHDEFVAGYKSVKPNSQTMLDQCKTPQDRLKMLEIMELTERG